MIRFATIGTNFIVDWFLRDSACCPELLHAGVYSRHEETARAFAEKHGISRIYTDLEELARDKEIDAVYIASPNSLHCPQAVKMLSHGKHVLCEKPIASNERELALMKKAADAGGAFLMEAMRSVYDPVFADMLKDAQRIAPLRRVSLCYCQYSSRYDRFRHGEMTNAFDPAFSNGALMDIGSYCVHALVKWFGMPDKICADAILLKNGIDGAGVITAAYERGLEADLVYSKIADSARPSELQGENGSILFDSVHNPTAYTLTLRGGAVSERRYDKPAWNMGYEAAAFARAVNEGRKSDLTASFYEMRVIDEARRQIGLRFPADDD